jgi:chaperonin cofactor prefoldin
VYTVVLAKNETFPKSRQTWTNSSTTLQDKVNAFETELTAMRQQLITTGENEITQNDLLKRTRSKLNAIVTQKDHLTSELAESNQVIEKLR